MRWRIFAWVSASLRFSSELWIQVPTNTASTKNSTMPRQKNVTTLSLVSPARPSPAPASAGAARTSEATVAAMVLRRVRARIAPHVIAAAGDNAGSVAEHDNDDKLLCYVEIPKGSRNKYEYDEEIGA